MTGPVALELEGFSAYYGAMAAVREVSLRVERGSAVGILGPNGAGKSTLLMGAAGFLRCSGGVALGGRDAARLSPVRRRRAGLALVPQQQAVVAGLSPKLIGELVDAIRTMNDRGLTVLLVEQNVSVVERTCERLHVLNGGQVVWDGETTSIDRDRIGDLYAGFGESR